MRRVEAALRRHAVVAGLAVVVAAGTLVVGAHYTSEARASIEGAPQAMPVMFVTAHVQPADVWAEFSGRLTAVESAEIRPQVAGRIERILFKEGAQVKKGQPLFLIDARSYQASLDLARAALAAAQSQATLAKAELKRAQGLAKNNYISKTVLDQRSNSLRTANAAIRAAQAEIAQARLGMEYAQVKAPISGRVGRAELTVGNVVEAGGNAPVLTTIVANDKLYAEFEVDEQTYLHSMRKAKGGEDAMPVQLRLGGDAVMYNGTIQSFDNQINTGSGTIRARAIFDNADGVLVPGMYATVRLAAAKGEPAVLISEKYVGTNTGERFVLLVGENNMVEHRTVVLGANVGKQRIVESGLKEGDKIITSGLMMLQPKMPVQPKEMPAEGAPQAAVN